MDYDILRSAVDRDILALAKRGYAPSPSPRVADYGNWRTYYSTWVPLHTDRGFVTYKEPNLVIYVLDVLKPAALLHKHKGKWVYNELVRGQAVEFSAWNRHGVVPLDIAKRVVADQDLKALSYVAFSHFEKAGGPHVLTWLFLDDSKNNFSVEEYGNLKDEARLRLQLFV